MLLYFHEVDIKTKTRLFKLNHEEKIFSLRLDFILYYIYSLILYFIFL